MNTPTIQARLSELANPQNAELAQRFFKTGPGQYAEGDIFLGIRVPVLRKIAAEYQSVTMEEAKNLLLSPIHEERLLALYLLIQRAAKGDEKIKKSIYEFYLDHTRFINNWDLVDTSAEPIVGKFLIDKDKKPLYELAKSDNLWNRRIAIMSTFCFIKQGHYSETLQIAKIFLSDREDLIHKATGWMLREVGKRNLSLLEHFLKEHCQTMPRTMLRYAIEKLPDKKKQAFLKGTI